MGILGNALFLKEKFFPSKKEADETPKENVYFSSGLYTQDGGSTWIRSEYCYNQSALEDAYRNGTRDATNDIVKNLIHEMEATINYDGIKYKVTVKKEKQNVDLNDIGSAGNIDESISVRN